MIFSGVMVERLDQVLIAGGRAAPERTSSTFFSRCLSMNGPFLTERAICFLASLEKGFGFRVPGVGVQTKTQHLTPHTQLYFTRRSRTIMCEVRLVLRVL